MTKLTLSVQWNKRLKLWAEGNKLWSEAIIEAFGNITLEWKYNSEKDDYECHLENGEVYKP